MHSGVIIKPWGFFSAFKAAKRACPGFQALSPWFHALRSRSTALPCPAMPLELAGRHKRAVLLHEIICEGAQCLLP